MGVWYTLSCTVGICANHSDGVISLHHLPFLMAIFIPENIFWRVVLQFAPSPGLDATTLHEAGGGGARAPFEEIVAFTPSRK